MCEYVANQEIGNFGVVFLEETKRRPQPCGTSQRFGVFVCPLCSTKFEAQIQAVKRGLTKSCGCLRGKKVYVD